MFADPDPFQDDMSMLISELPQVKAAHHELFEQVSALEEFIEAKCCQAEKMWSDVDALDIAIQAAEVLSQDPTASNVMVSVAKATHASLCLTLCGFGGMGRSSLPRGRPSVV